MSKENAVKPVTMYSIADDIRTIVDDLVGDKQEEGWEGRLDEAEQQLDKKTLAVRHVLTEMEATAVALKGESARLTKYQKQYETAADNLKEYIMNCMDLAGRTELVNEQGMGIKIQLNPPSVEIEDLDALKAQHPELVETTIPAPVDKPDKAAIKKAFDAGEEIAGVTVVQKRRVKVV